MSELASLDMDARYRVDGFGGIAFWIARPETEWRDGWEDSDESGPYYVEPEEVETGRVIVVMVGDDHRYTVDPEDLTVLDDLAYCHVCGQLGCGHDGLDRSEQ